MDSSASLRQMGRTGLFEREIKVARSDGKASITTGDVPFLGRAIRWFKTPPAGPEGFAADRGAVFDQMKNGPDRALIDRAIANFENNSSSKLSQPLTNRQIGQIFEAVDIAVANKMKLEAALQDLPRAIKGAELNRLRPLILQAVSAQPGAFDKVLDKSVISKIVGGIRAELAAETHAATRTRHAVAGILKERDVSQAWHAQGARHLEKTDGGELEQRFNRVTKSLGEAYSLLSEVPMCREEAGVYLDSLQNKQRGLGVEKILLEELSAAEPSNALVQAMSEDVASMSEALSAQIKESTLYLSADPLSADALARNDAIWMQAGELVLRSKINAAGGKDTALLQKALDNLRSDVDPKNVEAYRAKLNKLEKASKEDPKAAGKKFKKVAKVVPVLVERALRNAGLNKAEVHKSLHAAHLEVLNHTQRWKPVERSFSTPDAQGKLQAVKSTLTPASSMEARGYFPVQYKPETGVSCETISEKDHAVNLAESTLSFGGKTVFKGLRHGVHCAFGITNVEQRHAANLARANESIIAALVQSGKMGNALNGEKPELRLTSISLMTPDDVRGGVADEKLFVKEQLALWEELSKQGAHTLQVRGEGGQLVDVTIKLEVAACNFGVNTGALTGVGRHVSGWGNVQAPNQKAIDKMLVWANTYSGENAATVKQLASQIKSIWDSGAYAKMGNEPYKMVARLAVLAHLMGVTPLWNCKSGKDRTGRLDAEIKFLMLQIHKSGGKVPQPDVELNRADQALMRDCVLKSGNLELQEINTGVAGYKAKGVAANETRSGDRTHETFGASAATSA